MVRGFNAIINFCSNYLTWENKIINKTWISRYHFTVYSHTQNGSLLTTAVARKNCVKAAMICLFGSCAIL